MFGAAPAQLRCFPGLAGLEAAPTLPTLQGLGVRKRQGTVGFQRNIPRLPIPQLQDVVSPQCVPVHQGVLDRGSLLLLGKTAWVFFAISAFFLDFFFSY